jgi:DNA-binding transcriptional MocR family regulator
MNNIKWIKRPPTLKEVVIDRLREDICRGFFLPGQTLSEMKLTNLLNVSRGTLREALLQLKDEGDKNSLFQGETILKCHLGANEKETTIIGKGVLPTFGHSCGVMFCGS